jgi:hypothetical protein
LGIKNIPAIATMMLSIGEREGRSTPHTDIRIDPFGRLSMGYVGQSTQFIWEHFTL